MVSLGLVFLEEQGLPAGCQGCVHVLVLALLLGIGYNLMLCALIGEETFLIGERSFLSPLHYL